MRLIASGQTMSALHLARRLALARGQSVTVCPSADGLGFECLYKSVVKGDALVSAISAASILAKTTRDALMCELDARYPGFSLSGHKGYGTPSHVAALNALGPSPLHRRSFSPVRLGCEAIDVDDLDLSAELAEAF